MKNQKIAGFLIVSLCSLVYALAIIVAQATKFAVISKGVRYENYMDYIPPSFYALIIFALGIGIYLIFHKGKRDM